MIYIYTYIPSSSCIYDVYMYFQVVGVACGAEHTLLLSVSGQVYGSGCNAYGQVCVCIQKTTYPYIVFLRKKKRKLSKATML
jgi:alpha-tubulin suppressor-like RCC1 family protein